MSLLCGCFPCWSILSFLITSVVITRHLILSNAVSRTWGQPVILWGTWRIYFCTFRFMSKVRAEYSQQKCAFGEGIFTERMTLRFFLPAFYEPLLDVVKVSACVCPYPSHFLSLTTLRTFPQHGQLVTMVSMTTQCRWALLAWQGSHWRLGLSVGFCSSPCDSLSSLPSRGGTNRGLSPSCPFCACPWRSHSQVPWCISSGRLCKHCAGFVLL